MSASGIVLESRKSVMCSFLLSRLNAATLALWIFIPQEHVLYKNILSTPVQATSAVMTCRIILNLRKYGRREIEMTDGMGRSVSFGGEISLGPAVHARRDSMGRDWSKAAAIVTDRNERTAQVERVQRISIDRTPLSKMPGNVALLNAEHGGGGMWFSQRDVLTTSLATLGTLSAFERDLEDRSYSRSAGLDRAGEHT